MTRKEFFNSAKENIVNGIFWSFGVTIGFILISTVVVFVLSKFSTLPVIGNFVASVVEATQSSLENR